VKTQLTISASNKREAKVMLVQVHSSSSQGFVNQPRVKGKGSASQRRASQSHKPNTSVQPICCAALRKLLMPAVGWLWQVRNLVYFHLDGIEHKFYNLMKENAL
jgi:hypothetical protein